MKRLLLLFVTMARRPHVRVVTGAAVLGILLLVVLVEAIALVVLLGERPVRFLLRPGHEAAGFS
jgi:hypothetical protein